MRPEKTLLKPIFLRLPEVQAVLGIGRTSVYRLLQEDSTFPKAVRLGKRAVAWRRAEIEEWAASRPRQHTRFTGDL